MPRGLPRPLCPELNLPVPWNVCDNADGTYLLGALDPDRTMEGEKNKLCQVCGDGLPEEAVFVVSQRDFSIVDALGLHERCARLALAHCPALRGHPKYDDVSQDYAQQMIAYVANTVEALATDNMSDEDRARFWRNQREFNRQPLPFPFPREDTTWANTTPSVMGPTTSTGQS